MYLPTLKSVWTRLSENNNTPQPLNQWTNSPFMGQQVGNCKGFTLTHCLADLFAKHRDPRSITLCIQHHIQLTSLSFQVSRPVIHSWDTAISIFTLKIQGQCHGGEVKVESHNMGPTFYRLTSLSFQVNRPSHSWDTFQTNFILKIQVQGHGWGQSWKSQSEFNILSTRTKMTIFQSFWCIIKNNDKNKMYSNCKCMMVTVIALVSIDDKPSSEPMMSFNDAYTCVSRPLWIYIVDWLFVFSSKPLKESIDSNFSEKKIVKYESNTIVL